jgi:NADPH-dependent 7-cyano-7-deazaguanine reductase QueF
MTATARQSILVPSDVAVTMTVSAELVHRCPFRDEVDRGRVVITWTTAGSTLELHALASWLRGFADDVISHEALTSDIRDHLTAMDGITNVTVRTTWQTAGVTVDVVSGQPLDGEGA